MKIHPIPFAPDEIAPKLIERFLDEKRPVFGQVATCGGEGIPQVRTVHLRYLKPEQILLFGTHVKSSKWAELTTNPHLSGCYFDEALRRQWRWKGTVSLESDGSASYTASLQDVWHRTREDVRRVYLLKYGGKCISNLERVDVDKICPSFGVVVCVPDEWDLYQMDSNDYAKDQRTIHRLIRGQWQSKEVSSLDGEEI